MLLRYLEAFVAFLFFITVITQLIVPLWNDRPIFPFLNKRKSKLEKNLKTLNELKDEQELADQLAERANTLNKQQEIQNDD